MRTWRIVLLVLFCFFLLMACSKDEENIHVSHTGGESVSLPTIEYMLNIATEGYYAKLINICWEDAETTCSLDEIDPVSKLDDDQPIKVKPGQLVELLTTLDALPPEGFKMNPDIVEIKLFKENDEPSIVATDQKLTAPQEKGTYYYSIYAKWTGNNKGEAYYAFALKVK